MEESCARFPDFDMATDGSGNAQRRFGDGDAWSSGIRAVRSTDQHAVAGKAIEGGLIGVGALACRRVGVVACCA